jgi:hypothetical protein
MGYARQLVEVHSRVDDKYICTFPLRRALGQKTGN